MFRLAAALDADDHESRRKPERLTDVVGRAVESEVDEGLRVEKVNEGPAANAGIRPGDIILSVNGDKVSSVDQLRSLAARNGKHLALQILRGNNKLFVAIKPAK